MKKFLAGFITFLVVLGLVRYVAFVTTGHIVNPQEGIHPTLNFKGAIHKVTGYITSDNPLFDFSDFYVDVQKIEYNFKSLTNALTAPLGSYYTVYTYLDMVGTGGAGPGGLPDEQKVFNSSGRMIGYFYSSSELKPGNSSFLDWLSFIGKFVLYIGKILISCGEILIDLFLCLITGIVKMFRLLFYLAFDFS